MLHSPNFKPAVDGETLQWGRMYILDPMHSYTFPAVTENYGTNEIKALPLNKNWQSLFDPVNNWSAQGTDTIGAGQLQTISTANGIITFFGELGSPNNIAVFE